jgi:hypothetical protein
LQYKNSTQNHTGAYFIIKKKDLSLKTRKAIYLLIPNFLYLNGIFFSFQDWLNTGEEFVVFVKR